MANQILQVLNAGRGETPAVQGAKFVRGDVVSISQRTALGPAEAVVACAIPPGFPAEYALADLLGEPRPLMITRPRRAISYILVREADPKPYLVNERDLRLSGKPAVEIGSIRREQPDV